MPITIETIQEFIARNGGFEPHGAAITGLAAAKEMGLNAYVDDRNVLHVKITVGGIDTSVLEDYIRADLLKAAGPDLKVTFDRVMGRGPNGEPMP